MILDVYHLSVCLSLYLSYIYVIYIRKVLNTIISCSSSTASLYHSFLQIHIVYLLRLWKYWEQNNPKGPWKWILHSEYVYNWCWSHDYWKKKSIQQIPFAIKEE